MVTIIDTDGNFMHSSGEDKPLGILVRSDSGVDAVSQQTGGYTCHHRFAKGSFVPWPKHCADFVQDILTNYFCGGKYGGWCATYSNGDSGIDKNTAFFIEAILQSTPGFEHWQVDRTMLSASEEAWIYLTDPRDPEKPVQGILVFENSD